MSQIPFLNEIIAPHLKTHPETIRHTLGELTKPGENYGSNLSAVDVILDGKHTLNLIAKTEPNNEYIRRLFNTPVTFRKEIETYEVLVKALREFAGEYLDVFPAYYGGKCCSDGSVLFLENLKVDGYRVGDRLVGFECGESELVLKKLSRFHGVPMAMKVLDPVGFERCVRKCLGRALVFEDMSRKEFLEPNRKLVFGLLEKVSRELRDVAGRYLGDVYCNYGSEFPVEPFATVAHNDFWTNNMLIEKNSLKIIDFQLTDYGSPAKDLLLFLFTSIELNTLRNKLDYFIDFYYDSLKETLEYFGIYTEEKFGKNKFYEELKNEAKTQLDHILMMLIPIFTKPEKAKRPDELNGNEEFDVSDLADVYAERVVVTVEEMVKRQWL